MAILSAITSQLRGEVAYQYLVGIRVHVNLFASQCYCQVGSVRGKVAARLLRGRINFLSGSLNDFANLLFGCLLDARVFTVRLFFSRGLHLADLSIHLSETALDIG